MTIGLCTGQNGFHGEIDEVNINHLPPKTNCFYFKRFFFPLRKLKR